MKRAWSAILTGLALLLLSGAFLGMQSGAQGQAEEGWTFLGGPTAPGGTVDAIAVAPSAPDTVYALVQGRAGERLFRSDDAALAWQQVHTFTAAVDALAVDPADPATLYAGAPDGLFRSTDGGLSWTQVYTVAAAFAVVSPILLYASGQIAEPNLDDRCYTGYFGVARSDDSGATWQMTPIGCAAGVTVIVVHPQNPDIIYVGGSGPERRVPLLLRSSDGGHTWISLPLTTLDTHLVYGLILDPTRPESLFASDLWGILHSTDGGDTWERITILPRGAYRLALGAGGTLYAVHIYIPEPVAVYRSEDGGKTWWVSLNTLPVGVRALVADPTTAGVLYAGLEGYGVQKSETGGSIWHGRNAGIRSLASVSALAVAPGDPNLIYAGAKAPPAGLFQSTDGGLTWRDVLSDTSVLAVAVHPVTPTLAYAGTSHGLYATQDGGLSWILVDTAFVIKAFATSVTSPTLMYAGGHLAYPGGAFQWYVLQFRVDQDGHLNLEQRTELLLAEDVRSLVVHPQNPAVILAGGTYRGKAAIWRTEDAGTHWQRRLAYAAGSRIVALARDPTDGQTFYAASSKAIYRSTDGGHSWQEVFRPALDFFPMLSQFDLVIGRLGGLYAAWERGVWRGIEEGREWVPWGLEGEVVLSLALTPGSPQVLNAGLAEGGVWRRTLPLWRVWLPLLRR